MTTAMKPEPTTTLAKIDERSVLSVHQLKGLFETALPLLQKALPYAMRRSAERLSRCAVTEFQKNPLLTQCTGLSILSCTVQAAQLGLDIGGVMGQSYMVPYNRKIGGEWVKEAQFQIGYRGMIALAYRSGHIGKVYGEIVREKDVFKLTKGTDPSIEHRPAMTGAGKMIGAYSVVVYTSREISVEWMSREELEHHRDTYSKSWQSAKTPDDKARTPWGTAFNEMAKKTVLRRHLKLCPFSAEIPDSAFNDERDTPTVTVAADTVTLPTLPASADPDLAGNGEEHENGDEPKKEAEPPKTTEREKDAPEVTDDKAFLALLDRKKGITWAAAIGKVNTRFKTEYDGAVPWEEIALEHRRWIVEVVAALDDLPGKKK